MFSTVCLCCGGKMNVTSARNPNVCVGCEQLLEDDSAALVSLRRREDAKFAQPPQHHETAEESPTFTFVPLDLKDCLSARATSAQARSG